VFGLGLAGFLLFVAFMLGFLAWQAHRRPEQEGPTANGRPAAANLARAAVAFLATAVGVFVITLGRR